MNCGMHDTAMKMSCREAFLPPFQGSRGWGSTQGSAFGSTLGYIPVLTGHMVNRSYRAHGEQIPRGNVEW